MDAQQVRSILDALEQLYPQARPELNFSNPYETLIATILSAQCTDRRVNQVTQELFARYPDAEHMAKLTPEELEPIIKPCGLYHHKAKNIIETSRALVERFDGKVPESRAELMSLPGVGQKTAGVVLLAAFGDDQIPVDTHVFRVSNRIGLAHASTAAQTEAQLRDILPRDSWSHAHHLIIWHGRRACHARKPACESCPLYGKLCEYSMKSQTED